MTDIPKKLPRDRLELLLTTRKTYLIRLKSDLMRVEDEIAWCKRYLPDGLPLEGDEQVADLLRQMITIKERSIESLTTMLADAPDDR